jgi:hypothetical protein
MLLIEFVIMCWLVFYLFIYLLKNMSLHIVRFCLFCIGLLITIDVEAYPNEVRQSGDRYVWRINNVDMGSTTDLATAINNCIGTGNREVHILASGTLSRTIDLRPGLTIYGHHNVLSSAHSGHGFYIEGSGPIKMADLIFNNYGGGFGIRTTRAGNLEFSNLTIRGGGIGLRIDSHPSRPYEDGRWVHNVKVVNCTFENTGGHGLETYGVDGFYADGIVARNTGGCGVLLNKTINGVIGTVDSHRSNFGGGYAGLRFANNNSKVTVDMLYADECGRGYFVLTGSNNIELKNCQISNSTDVDIWLENVVNCTVTSGCVNSAVRFSGVNNSSHATVSTCSPGSSHEGTFRVQNIETGLYLDGLGHIRNESVCGLSSNVGDTSTDWEMIRKGTNYQFRNIKTGLYLDGRGLTVDGSGVFQHTNTVKAHTYWTVKPAAGSAVNLQNHETGLYLDVINSEEYGSLGGQTASAANQTASWRIVPVKYNVQVQNRRTGLVLDGMSRFEDGSVCGQWANTTGVNSQWLFEMTDEGYFRIQNRRTGMYLNGLGNKTNGSVAGLKSDPDDINAQWEIIDGPTDYVFIRNRGTNMYLDGMARTGNGSACGQQVSFSNFNYAGQWQIKPLSQILTKIVSSVDKLPMLTATDIKLFPNPAVDYLSVSMPFDVEETVVRIFDISGKLMIKQIVESGTTTLNISKLEPGIYLLKARNNKWATHQQFVKK